MSTELKQPWKERSNEELIIHILERYHQVHRQQLADAIDLARRVENVHGDLEDCPHGLTELLTNMLQELESHMMKEEQILFPMLASDTYPSGPIMVMEQEHEQHADELQRLDEVTNNLKLPIGACNTWTTLYKLLGEFKADLQDHIVLESEVLFVPEEQHAGHCCGGCS